MARHFLHLVDGEDVLLDPEGVEASADEVRQIALRSARDCIAGDVLTGTIDLTDRIEVHDAAGTVVHTLPFKDVVTVKG
jgi:hypothetical protein